MAPNMGASLKPRADDRKAPNLPHVRLASTHDVCFCLKCTISNQRPRITFDQHGVCSACNYAEFKKTIDWAERERELKDLCDRYRKTNGDYDVIVPSSGGKDSGFVAHQLKYQYGMNPLTVTWSPLKATEIGRKNLDAFIDAGFDNVMGKPNGQITRKLTALSLKYMGDPFQPFIYGQTNFPLQMAVRYKVPLVMYGENGEVEYGGDMKNSLRPNRDITDHDKHYFSGKSPEFWIEHGIAERELKPFMAPDYESLMKNGTSIHFMGYYKFWNPQENYYYCAENTGFECNPERSEGTYSKYASLDDCFDGFHYYLAFIKFGIGRATSDAAHEIRDDKITRDEGIALIKRFDGEFPHKRFKEFLDFCSMSEQEFHDIVDGFRSEHIWKNDNGWKLRHPIW